MFQSTKAEGVKDNASYSFIQSSRPKKTCAARKEREATARKRTRYSTQENSKKKWDAMDGRGRERKKREKKECEQKLC